MYECPNCGSGFRFDIKTQALLCDHCQTTMNPYDYEKDHDAEQIDEYEITKFSCTQCGAEIVGTENAAAAFCSFCGSSTILDAHLTKEKRPKKIIPFSQTKEDCKTAYANLMKKAIFAPKELKDPKYVDNFRGIYMPYWLYNISQSGHVNFPGRTESRSGDYIIKKNYNCSADVTGDYKDLSFDAASTFDDAISSAIATYDTSKMADFTPSMLCGFYADVADVDKELYQAQAVSIANNNTAGELYSHSSFRRYGPDRLSETEVHNELHTHVSSVESALYPVWFLSYRKNDRIAYATVNGQNGKLAVDIPIDIKKFMITSGILALILFMFLNMAFTFTPRTSLLISIIIALISILINRSESRQIVARETNANDKGYLSKNQLGKSPELSKKGYIGALAGIIFALIIWLVAPVHDYYYYIAAAITAVGVLFTLIDVVQKFNRLSTRKLPQFNRTGGDDGAY